MNRDQIHAGISPKRINLFKFIGMKIGKFIKHNQMLFLIIAAFAVWVLILYLLLPVK